MPRSRVFKSRAMLKAEAKIGRDLEAYFAEAYQSKTQAQIADELGFDTSTINRWMRDLDIEARFPGQKPPSAEAVA